MISWKKYSYKVEGKKTERRKRTYVKPSYNINDIYRFFKETYINNSVSKKNNVDLKVFKEIQYEYNKVLSRMILEGHQIKIPYGLGEIGIRRKKQNFRKQVKNMALDWNHYNKTGEKIVYLHSDSNYWQARWYWSRNKVRVDGHRVYSFTPSCTNKKRLAKNMKMKNGYLKYYEAKKIPII